MSCRRHQRGSGKRRAVGLLTVFGLSLHLLNRSRHRSSPPTTGPKSAAFIQGSPSPPLSHRIWRVSQKRGADVKAPPRSAGADSTYAVEVQLADLKRNATATDIPFEENDADVQWEQVLGWEQILGVRWLPDAVDAVLAALGAGSALALVSTLDGFSPVRLYAPPLAASCILIFAGVKLPAVKNVLIGSAGPALGSVFCSSILNQYVPTDVSRSVSVIISLFFFKLTGFFFPPAAALAALGVENESFAKLGWTYILFPAVTGNALLYLLALPIAKLREKVKKTMTQQQWQMGTRDEKTLRDVFNRCDLDGSGTIDVEELQLVLKYLSGKEVSAVDCEALMSKADANGGGTLDFEEFTELFANYEAYAAECISRRK